MARELSLSAEMSDACICLCASDLRFSVCCDENSGSRLACFFRVALRCDFESWSCKRTSMRRCFLACQMNKDGRISRALKLFSPGVY